MESTADALSDSDPAPGTCIRSQGHAGGLHPLCWYKPWADGLPGLWSGARGASRGPVGRESAALGVLRGPEVLEGSLN